MEVIQRGINIEIVPAVSERIYCRNRAFGGIGNDGAGAPRIVGIPCNGVRVFIDNADYIALKVLLEVERFIVIDDTANTFLIIVKRDKRIAAPSLAKYLRAVKCVGMLYTVYGLGCAYAVGVDCIIPFPATKVNKKLRTSFEVRSEIKVFDIQKQRFFEKSAFLAYHQAYPLLIWL